MLSFTNKKIIFVTAFLLLILLGYGCWSILPRTTIFELKGAYEKYHKITAKAYLTLDTSELAQVATGKVLEADRAWVENRKKNNPSPPRGYEVRIFPLFGFRILETKDDHAIVEVRTQTRYFYLNPQTGKRTYSGGGDWFSEKVEMIKENGVWKVKEFVQVEKWMD